MSTRRTTWRRPQGRPRKPRPEAMDASELCALLESSGRSHYWLAAQLGVARHTVSRWSRGECEIPLARTLNIRALLSTTCPVCGTERHS